MNMIGNTLDAPAASASMVAGPSRNGEIEVLRAVAILMVLVQHVPLNLLFWKARINNVLLQAGGWTGVDLFFAISGFVIARPLLPMLAQAEDAAAFLRLSLRFWQRRAWRLLPSAWLWLVLPLFLCVFFNASSAYGPLQANWEMLVAGVLDLVNFRTAYIFGHYPQGTAFVQWSLSLEEQFYLLLPLAVFVCRRRLPWLLLAIAALGFVVPNAGMGCQARLWPIALGVLIAIWSHHQTYDIAAPAGFARVRTARTLLLVVGVAFLLTLGDAQFHIVPFYQGPISIIAAVLVWVASYDRGYLWQPGATRRVMEIIAARSYSLYLVHIPVYFAMHEIFVRLHDMATPNHRQAVVILAGGFAGTFLVAELNYRLVERPFRDHGKRVTAPFGQAEAEVTA
jgi:peptidoglycan/LPS O-acetylase OafA/YrhL